MNWAPLPQTKYSLAFARAVASPPSTTASLVVLPRISCVWRATARTAWQASDKGIDQPLTHGCDRVRDVAFRPQGGILWVGNRRVLQVSGIERRNEVLRGESSPSRRSRIRRPRCTAWRDGGSRATRVLQSDPAPLLA